MAVARFQVPRADVRREADYLAGLVEEEHPNAARELRRAPDRPERRVELTAEEARAVWDGLLGAHPGNARAARLIEVVRPAITALDAAEQDEEYRRTRLACVRHGLRIVGRASVPGVIGTLVRHRVDAPALAPLEEEGWHVRACGPDHTVVTA